MEVVLFHISFIWLMRIMVNFLDITHLTDGIDVNVFALVQYKEQCLGVANFLEQSFRRMG